MTRIAAAATILAAPAPVFVIDTCSFIDLFRHDDSKKWQRVPSDEIRAAVELLSQATSSPKTAVSCSGVRKMSSSTETKYRASQPAA